MFTYVAAFKEIYEQIVSIIGDINKRETRLRERAGKKRSATSFIHIAHHLGLASLCINYGYATI